MASKAGNREPRRYSDGVPVWQPSSGRHIQAGSNVARSRHRCLVPPVETHGGSWRSGSAASDLPGRRLPRNLLSLFALRSWTALLQPGMPAPSAAGPAPTGQPPPPAESGRPARSSRPPTGIPPAPGASAGDGSWFPFDRFPGIICMWDGKGHCHKSSTAIQRRWATPLAGKTARHTPVLPDLWSSRAFH